LEHPWLSFGDATLLQLEHAFGSFVTPCCRFLLSHTLSIDGSHSTNKPRKPNSQQICLSKVLIFWIWGLFGVDEELCTSGRIIGHLRIWGRHEGNFEWSFGRSPERTHGTEFIPVRRSKQRRQVKAVFPIQTHCLLVRRHNAHHAGTSHAFRTMDTIFPLLKSRRTNSACRSVNSARG